MPAFDREPESRISDSGVRESAWRIRIYGRDLFPVSIKILRAARHAVAWMPVCRCRSVGVSDIRVSMRLIGAGYILYSSTGFATYF